ncbi:MAG TPA: DUF2269 family protein [Vicinamibacterales bacterium]|nr:DUF2269 family protein [Vicinamibacterales bacterium]
MPDIAPFHETIVLVHVVGVVLFLLAHAVSVVVLFLVQRERDPSALRRLLTLSRQSLLVAFIGLAVWFLSGVLAGFSGGWWTSGRFWVWASLLLAIVLIGLMTPMGRFYFNRVREAVGIDLQTNAINSDARVDPAAVDAAVASGRPLVLAALGIVGLVAILWLMLAKPF